MFDAAVFSDLRLHELYCGFDRRSGLPPVDYPVACSPQAWAAAVPLMLTQAFLGISAQAPGGGADHQPAETAALAEPGGGQRP